MPRGHGLEPHELDAIKAGHAAGKSCNAIARELGRSPSSVSKHAERMGLSWSAARTAAATEAKQAGNRERRAALVARLYKRAETIMDRLEGDQFKLVGMDKDGRARTNHIDSDAIPGNEERALTGMVVNTLVAAARLEAVDAAHTDNGHARGILADFGAHLQAAYGQLAHTGNTATAADLEDELREGEDG